VLSEKANAQNSWIKACKIVCEQRGWKFSAVLFHKGGAGWASAKALQVAITQI